MYIVYLHISHVGAAAAAAGGKKQFFSFNL